MAQPRWGWQREESGGGGDGSALAIAAAYLAAAGLVGALAWIVARLVFGKEDQALGGYIVAAIGIAFYGAPIVMLIASAFGFWK